MKTILIILLLSVIAAGGIYIATKFFGKFKDDDKDGIPDVIEDKVEEVKETAKKTVTKAKTRVKKIKAEITDVVEELSDVVSAIKGKPTKTKLNSLTKEQLVDAAKVDHAVKLDGSVKKSTLVNKVYSLYNKPQK